MFLKNYRDVPAERPESGAEGVSIRWLITEAEGAERFAMRHFELAPGGYTPRHSHDWEHEVFVLEGEGLVYGADGTKRFKKGDFLFIAPGELHQFRNDGTAPVELLCMIPVGKGSRR